MKDAKDTNVNEVKAKDIKKDTKNKTKDIKDMTVDELQAELLILRKEQFTLRMKKAIGTLDKKHLVTIVRKNVARVKTMMTQKAGISHV